MSDDINRLHIELDYGEIVNFSPSTLLSTILFPENLINFASKTRPVKLVHFLNSSSAVQILIRNKNIKTK